jgi:glycosyltransferase involved in cell wall biosynthesis
MPGRITRQKSPQLLARALGLLRERDELPADLRVMLVGEGEDAAVQAELNAAIQGHRLTDVLSQHEQTPQPETFYHAADVTVLPSLWEGMPNGALESLAAGHPVIISEAANAAQIVIHNETGWVVKTGDVEHLAETLKRVACLSTEELQAMQQACLRRAADFSMQRMVASYEHLYERLTAMPKP